MLSTADSCQQWEIAVEICQALVDYHKHHTYNLKRIAELLGSEALMYSSMSQVKRQETVYYRVVRGTRSTKRQNWTLIAASSIDAVQCGRTASHIMRLHLEYAK